MNRLLVLASLALVGCFNPSAKDGVECGPGGECPPGLVCGADNRCTSDVDPPDDASVPDDAAIDAAPDAEVVEPPGPRGPEATSGAGTVEGNTYKLDVQIGHPVEQSPATGAGGKRVEGASAVKP